MTGMTLVVLPVSTHCGCRTCERYYCKVLVLWHNGAQPCLLESCLRITAALGLTGRRHVCCTVAWKSHVDKMMLTLAFCVLPLQAGVLQHTAAPGADAAADA
jgi:hypothetical protein